MSQTLSTKQQALSTSAAVVLAANPGRDFAEIKNTDESISVYVGPTGITSSTGHLVKAGESFSFERFAGAIYAVAASGTPTVTAVEW